MIYIFLFSDYDNLYETSKLIKQQQLNKLTNFVAITVYNMLLSILPYLTTSLSFLVKQDWYLSCHPLFNSNI